MGQSDGLSRLREAGSPPHSAAVPVLSRGLSLAFLSSRRMSRGSPGLFRSPGTHQTTGVPASFYRARTLEKWESEIFRQARYRSGANGPLPPRSAGRADPSRRGSAQRFPTAAAARMVPSRRRPGANGPSAHRFAVPAVPRHAEPWRERPIRAAGDAASDGIARPATAERCPRTPSAARAADSHGRPRPSGSLAQRPSRERTLRIPEAWREGLLAAPAGVRFSGRCAVAVRPGQSGGRGSGRRGEGGGAGRTRAGRRAARRSRPSR